MINYKRVDMYFNLDPRGFYSWSSYIQYFYDLIMFIEKTDMCNFANDNTLYKSSPNLAVFLALLRITIDNKLTFEAHV